MPRTVTYHLRANQLITMAGAAQATVIRPGRITGVSIKATGVAGASSGFVTVTADLNNPAQSFGDVNAPPREAILDSILWSAGTTETRGVQGCYVPLSIPVVPGDILSIGQVVSGTAPGTFKTVVDVVVMENG